MLDKLIKWLGGYSREEYQSLEKEYDHQRELVNQSRAREEFNLKSLEEEKTERKFLQDILFKKFGIVDLHENVSEDQSELRPVNNGPVRWSNLKARLESDDAKRAKFNA